MCSGTFGKAKRARRGMGFFSERKLTVTYH